MDQERAKSCNLARSCRVIFLLFLNGEGYSLFLEVADKLLCCGGGIESGNIWLVWILHGDSDLRLVNRREFDLGFDAVLLDIDCGSDADLQRWNLFLLVLLSFLDVLLPCGKHIVGSLIQKLAGLVDDGFDEILHPFVGGV